MSYRFIKYQKKYLSSCADLVKNTWNLHQRFKNMKNINSVYELYVRGCVDYSEHTELIVDENNKVHGILFGSIENRNLIQKLKCLCKVTNSQIWLKKSLRNGDFGDINTALNSFKISKAINDLGEQYAEEFDSEVNLFIVSTELRGKRFGLKLMNNYLDFCKKNHLKSTFLWTELSCTYSFYDKYGFKLYKTFYHENLTKPEQGEEYNGMIYSLNII